MIKKTMEGVRYLIQNELYMASDDHGKKFHSDHKAYGVIQEEFEETMEELAEIRCGLDEMWQQVRADGKFGEELEYISKHAMNAACEAIQVAAMARKAMR